MFMCPSTLNDEPHIQALASAVTAGSRRRFSLIDRATMLQSVPAHATSAIMYIQVLYYYELCNIGSRGCKDCPGSCKWRGNREEK